MFGFFSFMRKNGFPTMYPEARTAAETDILEAGFISAFIILAACFFLALPAIRGKAQVFVAIRVVVSLIIGAVLMTSNFGQDWETAHVSAKTPYKAGQPHEIDAVIGLKIGLRSINVTLARNNSVAERKHEEKSPLDNEMINYNEQFHWTWDQGRFGFGKFAGRMQQEFRQGQLYGLPLPILWVAEYFTIDGEGLRWGRFYRTAGWYAHIAMWSAFPCWLLANILFVSVIRYGAIFTLLTGMFQVLACILWAVIRNPTELVIPFGNAQLITSYGANFWLTLTTGTVCILLAFVILFFDLRYPDDISAFFGIDPLSDYEEYLLSAAELEVVRKKCANKGGADCTDIEMNAVTQAPTEDVQPYSNRVLKRRTTIRKAQKALFRSAAITNTIEEDEQPLYLNVAQPRSPGVSPDEQGLPPLPPMRGQASKR